MADKYTILASFCKKGRTLDVGFAQNPNPHLRQCDGLDVIIPETKPKNYRKLLRVNLNSEPIPARESSYDNVVMGDVIEHVENPSFLLREANRILKKNGRLIICTPQANDWWVTIHNRFLRRFLKDPDCGEHLSDWTILDMHRLLKKNGFHILKTEGYMFRTPFRKPFTQLFRVKRFPSLAWQVFYVAEKAKEPNENIIIRFGNEYKEVK